MYSYVSTLQKLMDEPCGEITIQELENDKLLMGMYMLLQEWKESLGIKK